MDYLLSEMVAMGEPALLITLGKEGKPFLRGSSKVINNQKKDEEFMKKMETDLMEAKGDLEYSIFPEHKVNLPKAPVEIGGSKWKRNVPSQYFISLLDTLRKEGVWMGILGQGPTPSWCSKEIWGSLVRDPWKATLAQKTEICMAILVHYDFDPKIHHVESEVRDEMEMELVVRTANEERERMAREQSEEREAVEQREERARTAREQREKERLTREEDERVAREQREQSEKERVAREERGGVERKKEIFFLVL